MQRIDIELMPSKFFMSLIGLVWLGSLGILMSLSITGLLKIIFLMGALINGAWIFWVRVLMKSPHSIIGLQLLADGSCKLQYPLNATAAEIKGDSTVTSALCVLRFKIQGRRRKVSCVIFKDSLQAETYRKLLVWLRCWGASR